MYKPDFELEQSLNLSNNLVENPNTCISSCIVLCNIQIKYIDILLPPVLYPSLYKLVNLVTEIFVIIVAKLT